MGNVLGLPSEQRSSYRNSSAQDIAQNLIQQPEFVEFMKSLGHFFHEHGEYQKHRRRSQEQKESRKSRTESRRDLYDIGQHAGHYRQPWTKPRGNACSDESLDLDAYPYQYSSQHRQPHRGHQTPYMTPLYADYDVEDSIDHGHRQQPKRRRQHRTSRQNHHNQSAYVREGGDHERHTSGQKRGRPLGQAKTPYEARERRDEGRRPQEPGFSGRSDNFSGNNLSKRERGKQRKESEGDGWHTESPERTSRPRSH
ncbi:hypothetical protein MMC06_003012 [Schaereria dolodes]|nr:hypothetical protein [Schaereria dolodes]